MPVRPDIATDSAKPLRVAILALPAGKGNLGDEALLASVIQSLRFRAPGVEILALTGNPEDTLARHGIPAAPAGATQGRPPAARGASPPTVSPSRSALERVPGTLAVARAVRRAGGAAAAGLREIVFLARSLDRIRGTRLLVVSGSGVLSDHFGGPMNLPYTICKWCALARLAGTRIAFLSMGAGPLESRRSRWFVKRSLGWADYHSVRDETSKRIVDGLGVRGPTPVFPDLVHSLRLPEPIVRPASAAAREIGINPFPQFDPRYWPVRDRESYRGYVDRLASFCAELLRREYRLHLFPTQIRSDPLVIADLRQAILVRVPSADEHVVVPTLRTIEDLAAVLDGLDLVVATRFHGILLALMRARPVLAISNHHKMTELMVAAGQAAFVVPIDPLDPAKLLERFLALEADRARVSLELSHRMVDFSNRLDAQYDVAFRALGAGS